ncbi:MAG: hypothetical protein ACRDHY_15100 [Anaerolineales bacterium]
MAYSFMQELLGTVGGRSDSKGGSRSLSKRGRLHPDVTIAGDVTMAEWVNQHSFVLVSTVALLVLGGVLFRDGVRANDGLALVSLAGGLFLAYLLLRPGLSTHPEVAEVRRLIGGGRPVLLEFQSPY